MHTEGIKPATDERIAEIIKAVRLNKTLLKYSGAPMNWCWELLARIELQQSAIVKAREAIRARLDVGPTGDDHRRVTVLELEAMKLLDEVVKP